MSYYTRPVRNSSSRFKGVTRYYRSQWQAQYRGENGKLARIGPFDTEEEAARAYDEAALRLFGPDTFLNFRDMQSRIEPTIEGETAKIPLSGGGFCTIDVDDLPLVQPYYWHPGSSVEGTRAGEKKILLHTLLLGPIPSTHRAIHLNGNKLDYRRANLCIAPFSLNCARRHKYFRRGTTSIYKGVARAKDRWEARVAGVVIGKFSSETEAAQAYDDAARLKYGDLAAFNFPRPGEISCHLDPPAEKLAA